MLLSGVGVGGKQLLTMPVHEQIHVAHIGLVSDGSAAGVLFVVRVSQMHPVFTLNLSRRNDPSDSAGDLSLVQTEPKHFLVSIQKATF